MAIQCHKQPKQRPSPNTLLANAKILSIQLKSAIPYLWAERETQGFRSNQALPHYRIFHCLSQGLFVEVSSGEKHVENIHISGLDSSDNQIVNYFYAKAPLNYYLNHMSNHFKQNWPAALIEKYGRDLIPGFKLVKAWQTVDKQLTSQLWDGILSQLNYYQGALGNQWNADHYASKEHQDELIHWSKPMIHQGCPNW